MHTIDKIFFNLFSSKNNIVARTATWWPFLAFVTKQFEKQNCCSPAIAHTIKDYIN